jgi:2',5'-phosphodiesterase
VNRLQPRTTAVQAIIIQSIENDDEIIVVGNTHFYFQPDSDHIRVMQGGLTILWLNSIIEELKKNVLT